MDVVHFLWPNNQDDQCMRIRPRRGVVGRRVLGHRSRESEEVIPYMAGKKNNDRVIDVFTGIVLGALVGLYYPLSQYHMVLLVLGIVLAARFLKVVKIF